MTDDELKSLFDAMRQENSAAHEETRRRFDAVDATFEEQRRRFDAVDGRFDAVDGRFVELRRHFDVTAEAMKQEVRLVAESVAHVNGQLQSETNALRQEMSRGFAETQAMIKFSHTELDRRVNALEETVADLQSRVQRLESGTH